MITIIILTAITTFVSVFVVMTVFHNNSTLNSMKTQSEVIAGYAMRIIDTDSFAQINMPGDADSALYKEENEEMDKIRRIGGLKYLYTIKENAEGIPVYLVDGQPVGTPDFCPVGMEVEEGLLGDVVRALRGETVLAEGIKDTGYGPVYTSYWPGLDEQGVQLGILGIEYDAESVITFDKSAVLSSLVISIGLIAVMIFVFISIYRNVSRPFQEELVLTDAITGLSNRTVFETDIKEIQSEMGREDSLVLVVLGLCGVHRIGEEYGYQAGDDYLQQAAEVVVECFRELGKVYRIGGEEFALLCLDLSTDYVKEILDTDFTRKTNSLHEKISARFPVDGLGIAYGLSAYDPDRHANLYQVLDEASANMYIMKEELETGK